MTDWASLADVATAAGTALLAVATFSATRSANRSAKSAERAFLESLRPILVTSDWTDPMQKVNYRDGRWLHANGGRAAVDVAEDAVYVVLSVRNAGRGLAVLHGWNLVRDRSETHDDPDTFFRLTRDIYIPAGGLGYVQIVFRDRESEDFAFATAHAGIEESLVFDVLYGDAEGTQRVITRFSAIRGPVDPEDPTERALAASHHWNLDLPDPR